MDSTSLLLRDLEKEAQRRKRVRTIAKCLTQGQFVQLYSVYIHSPNNAVLKAIVWTHYVNDIIGQKFLLTILYIFNRARAFRKYKFHVEGKFLWLVTAQFELMPYAGNSEERPNGGWLIKEGTANRRGFGLLWQSSSITRLSSVVAMCFCVLYVSAKKLSLSLLILVLGDVHSFCVCTCQIFLEENKSFIKVFFLFCCSVLFLLHSSIIPTAV